MPAQGAPQATNAQDAPPQLERVVVRGNAVDNQQLAQKLGLRRPDLEFETLTGPRPREASELVVTHDGERLQLELTAADGRRYTREAPADSDIGTRAVASDAAAFLDAVERGTVTPEPRARARRKRKQSSKPQLGERMLEALELGAGLGPSLTIPIARRADARAGRFMSGELNLRVQSVEHIVVDLGVRVGGKRSASNGLRRTRLAFSGGYRLTRGAFDMPLVGGLTVEPWSIAAQSDDAPRLSADGVRLAFPPSMIGFAARASPAYLFTLDNGIAVRVGGGLEFAASSVPGAGVGAVEATREGADTPDLRVGGLETSILLEVGVWAPWSVIRKK